MRKTRSLKQWRSIIEEQQASDLTITDYCHQNALSKTTFYAARSKLNASSGSFVRAKVTKHVDVIEPQQPIILTAYSQIPAMVHMPAPYSIVLLKLQRQMTL